MGVEDYITKTQSEIDRDIQELIEADKALTQDERDEAWREGKLRVYRDQLQRQLEYLDKGVPSLLCALNAVNNYNVARALWEDDMFRVEEDQEREDRRKKSGRCVRCAHALPLPYQDGQDYCPACDKHINDTVAKYDGDTDAARLDSGAN